MIFKNFHINKAFSFSGLVMAQCWRKYKKCALRMLMKQKRVWKRREIRGQRLVFFADKARL